MAIGDTYNVKVNYCTPQGEMSVSQAYKQTVGTNDKDTCTALASAVQTGWVAKLLLALASDVELDSITVQPESGVNEVPGLLSLNGSGGAIAGDPLPNNIAQIVSQLTDAPNSNANGRLFVAGVSELQMEDGLFNAAQTALMQTFADDIDDDITAVGGGSATFVPVIISRFLSGAPRVPHVAFNVLSCLARTQPRQQRRRTTRRKGVA